MPSLAAKDGSNYALERDVDGYFGTRRIPLRQEITKLPASLARAIAESRPGGGQVPQRVPDALEDHSALRAPGLT